MARFQVLKDGELLTFSRYSDIPQSFDNLVLFEPDIIDGPHTDEQHEEMHKLNDMLLKLMSRETR